MSPERHSADPAGPAPRSDGAHQDADQDRSAKSAAVDRPTRKEEQAATPEGHRDTDPDTTVLPLQEALRAAEAEVLRSHAELENYRKRARRDMEEERRYASLPLMRDLLPVMDNLQRALVHAAQAGESEALLSGVRMVARELASTLEKHHCYLVEAEGVPFDPNYHEAIGQQPSTEVAAGHVALVVTDGYRLHDRVIRPAQVLVSTGAPDPTTENASSKE